MIFLCSQKFFFLIDYLTSRLNSYYEGTYITQTKYKELYKFSTARQRKIHAKQCSEISRVLNLICFVQKSREVAFCKIHADGYVAQ